MTPRLAVLLATVALATAVAGAAIILTRPDTTAAVNTATAATAALTGATTATGTDPTTTKGPAPYPTGRTAPATSEQAPATAPEQATTHAEQTPAPFIQRFAHQPGVPPQKALPSPTATLPVAVNVDGCDHSYGTRAQCIPWTFPAGVTDKCAWLTAHGYQRIPVAGPDRQHLDPDRNGAACDH